MKNKLMSFILCLTMLLCSLQTAVYADGENAASGFSDVPVTAWYYDSVAFCRANSILNGVSDARFSPNSGTTREQMMVVLAKISGDDVKGYAPTVFTDVRADAWYTDYINWAAAKEYTNGISESAFGVGKTLTRQEAVTLIYNYGIVNSLTQPAEGELSYFKDAERISNWAVPAFGWAVHNSILKGDNNSMLNPHAPVRRSELALIVKAFMENIVYGDCGHSYSTVNCELPEVCEGCGLIKGFAKGHSFALTDCTVGAVCKHCPEVLPPAGHHFKAADCTHPMSCNDCDVIMGEPLGHTTDNGVCQRCNTERFSDIYSKFAYYMTNAASADGALRCLRADVTHADGNTSKQCIKYDTVSGKGSFEIIFDFASNDHSIKTVIEFDAVSSLYVAKTDYMIGQRIHASSSANIYSAYFNKDQYVELSAYAGPAEHRALMRNLVKNSVLLSVDSSNRLLSEINMSVKDFGFTNFY